MASTKLKKKRPKAKKPTQAKPTRTKDLLKLGRKVIEAALALKDQAGSKGDGVLTTDLEIPKCLVVETASYCKVPPPGPGPLVIRIEMLPGNPAKPPGL